MYMEETTTLASEVISKEPKSFSMLWGINRSTGKPFEENERVDYLRKRLLSQQAENSFDDRDLRWLLTMALAWQLDPIQREIYLVPRGKNEKPIIVVGYQVYLKRTLPLCNRWDLNIFSTEKTHSKLALTFVVEGARLGDSKYLDTLACEIEISRKDSLSGSVPFSWTVYYREVARYTNPIWQKMPLHMLKKTAIAQTFRICFADILAGYPYVEEEV